MQAIDEKRAKTRGRTRVAFTADQANVLTRLLSRPNILDCSLRRGEHGYVELDVSAKRARSGEPYGFIAEIGPNGNYAITGDATAEREEQS